MLKKKFKHHLNSKVISRNVFLIFLFTIFTLSSTFKLFAAPKQDTVVATVDGQKIMSSELEQTFTQNQLYLSPTGTSKEKTLNDLINRRLGIIKAYKNHLDKDEVVLRKMEDILYHAQISQDLENQFKNIKVSDEEVKKYYEHNKEYRTAQILFRLKPNPTEDEMKSALTQALKIYEVLKKDPDKFSEIANKYSQITTSPTGGDIGFVPSARLLPEYYKAIYGKGLNYITPPFKTQMGVHIVKVIGEKTYEQIASDLYKKIIYDSKRDSIMDNHFAEMRKKATIKVNSENL